MCKNMLLSVDYLFPRLVCFFTELLAIRNHMFQYQKDIAGLKVTTGEKVMTVINLGL